MFGDIGIEAGRMVDTRTVTIGSIVVALLAATTIAGQYLYYTEVTPQTPKMLDEEAHLPAGEKTPVAPAADGPTAVTAHTFQHQYVVVLNPDGTVAYFNDTATRYQDVDPGPGRNTIEYTAGYPADHRCSPSCHRFVIEQVNLTTGENTVLYSRSTLTRRRGSHPHDADRTGPDTFLVGGILRDRVYSVNTTSKRMTWTWEAINHYTPGTDGGVFPRDWMHLNDVEQLPNGLVMASLRNADRVIFIKPGNGVWENWTLGVEDDYDILYEQHNPDYIPPSRGGPAVVVADSENDRIVEYQREDGSWTRTWTWRDAALSWGRDADRLPNNHTLISDTHGDRVVEINETGHVVWNFTGIGPYEAERLDTGDESNDGWSARAAELAPRTYEESSESVSVYRRILPAKLYHALAFLTPSWIDDYTIIAALLFVLSIATLAGLYVRTKLA